MLQYYIYINGINSTVYNIAHYGLFPSPSDQMDLMAPTMTAASKHFEKDGQVATDKFKTILENLTNDLSLQDNTDRLLKQALFPSSGQKVSLWIPFSLHVMSLHLANSAAMANNPIFERGNYLGTKQTATKTSLMDNNWLTPVQGKVHQIDNIADLKIINSSSTLLDKEHVAYFLFQFKEARNKQTPHVLRIIDNTNTWSRQNPNQQVFHIEPTTVSPTKKKKRSKTQKAQT